MSDLNQSSVSLLERAIDEKIRKAVRGGQSTHLATVTRVSTDGTTWVHVFGGSDETPVRRMTTAAQVGDVINVTFSGLSCMGVGNVSSPSATTGQVTKVADESATAIAGVMSGILQIRRLIADKITTGELDAEIARILNASIDTATVNTLNNMYANVNLANIVAADVDMAVIKDLVAESGLFQDLVITGDGTITGKLGAVLVDGDTARFSNIYADALKLLGPDGLYHALNMAGLSEGEAQVLVDAYGEALDGGLHGSHIIAESVTATQIDVTSLIAAMLLTEFVQVGASAGTHIEAKGDRFSFFSGGSGWKTMAEDYLYPLVENPTGNPFAKGWYEQVDKLDEYGRHVYTRTLDTEPGNALVRVYDSNNYAGRNLLRGTGAITSSSFTRTSSSATVTDNVLMLKPNPGDVGALYKADLLSYGDVYGKTLTLSCDVRLAPISSTYTSSEIRLYIGANKDNSATSIFAQNSWYRREDFTDIGSEWARYSITALIPDDLNTRGAMFIPNATSKVTVQFTAPYQKKPVEVRNIKLEIGSTATAYSVAYEDINPSEAGLYEIVGDAYVPSSDTAWSAEKAYYDESSDPKSYYTYNVAATNALPGEVAYIAVDPDTNESTFYMTRSVVVKDLRFGDWLWYGRRNRNMSLKWVGGEV